MNGTDKHSFFATVFRMRYIQRWELMRNARPENLAEHSADVAIIAHALCEIGNVRFGKSLDSAYAALRGLYHDVAEIVTGDMPTPVKYGTDEMRNAYRNVEKQAQLALLDTLPADLADRFSTLIDAASQPDDTHAYENKLVKAADKIAAYIKCAEEEQSGNREFRDAKKSIEGKLSEMAVELAEVSAFTEEFLPAYGQTLDECLGKDAPAP